MTISILNKRYVRLVCGHKPKRLAIHNGTGYCPRCQRWERIDKNKTNQLITAARKQQERNRSRRRWQR